MATFKSIQYLGNASSGDSTFTLNISGAASGDTVLLAVILPTNGLSTGTFTMPAGWVNAIDAGTPLARVDDEAASLSIVPFTFDGAPPTADMSLTTIGFRYVVAVVMTLGEDEALSNFQMEYSAATSVGVDTGVSYDSPGDGTLGVLAISEWLGAG